MKKLLVGVDFDFKGAAKLGDDLAHCCGSVESIESLNSELVSEGRTVKEVSDRLKAKKELDAKGLTQGIQLKIIETAKGYGDPEELLEGLARELDDPEVVERFFIHLEYSNKTRNKYLMAYAHTRALGYLKSVGRASLEDVVIFTAMNRDLFELVGKEGYREPDIYELEEDLREARLFISFRDGEITSSDAGSDDEEEDED